MLGTSLGHRKWCQISWPLAIVVVKYHRLDGLTTSNFLLVVLEAAKSKIKVLAYSFPDEDSPWIADGLLLSVCSHGADRSAPAFSSSYMGPSSVKLGHHPHDLI